ncbi:MAG: P-loop NTPase [Euryarchaeota archaeon]|nr:P-loop NTPase [Euryarchaeota archaeon]
MVRVCIASGKGGVGKSVICANLGVVLSERGYRVSLVDADIEGPTLGLLFGYEHTQPTLHDYLSGNASAGDVVKSLSPTLSAVFGSVQLNALLKELELERLSELTSMLEQSSDLVLVDSPPGLEEDTKAAVRASEEVLVVLNPDIPSVAGALKVRILARREGRHILGVVANRTGGEYDIPPEELEAILEEEVLGTVRDDPLVRSSLVEGIPVVSAHPESPAAVDIRRLADRLVEKLIPPRR